MDVSAAGSTSSRHQGLAYGQQQPPVESAEERESAGSPAYTTSGPTPSASTATARVEHPLMLSLSESDAEAAVSRRLQISLPLLDLAPFLLYPLAFREATRRDPRSKLS